MVQLAGSPSWTGNSAMHSESGTASHQDLQFLPVVSISPFRTTLLEWVEQKWMDALQLPKNFLIYVFSLPLQLSHKNILEIQVMVRQWAQWDTLESLANYHSTVETLFGIVKRGLMRDSLWISHLISEEVSECLSSDVYVLHDKFLSIFRHRESYKRFLACRDNPAQRLMDLLQDVLDSVPESPARPKLSKALLRLSRVSGLHPTCFPLTDLQIDGHQVAAGAFGDIWKGLVQGQAVSVKMMRIFRDVEMRVAAKAFGREALIWRQLSHPNLLPFFGLYYAGNRLCLVSPWMSNGHILQFLETAPPDTDRVSLILDVALGLQYLHDNRVVHADLKGPNVLVTPSKRACVADFGLSSIMDAMSLHFTHSTSSAKGGTIRYQAPELWGGMENHYGSDIYAFACVCYEILTGKVPFFEFAHDAQVMFKVLADIRPTRPITIPSDDSLWLLMEECWKPLFSDRPNVSQVVQYLLGPSVRATPRTAAIDWDETISSRFRRSLQHWQLVPSISAIERRIFGDDVVEGFPHCFPERLQQTSSRAQQNHRTGSTSSDHEVLLRSHPSAPRHSLDFLSIPQHNFSIAEALRLFQNASIPPSCLAAHHRAITRRMLIAPPSDIPPWPRIDASSYHSEHWATGSDGNSSVFSTPELDQWSHTPPQETPSDHFAPTPDNSVFEAFEPQVMDDDDNLGPSLSREWDVNKSGLSLFGGEDLNT